MPTDERTNLLAYARDLAVEFGPRAFSLQALALRADVPLETVREHFADGNEVLLAIGLEGTREHRDLAAAAMASSPHPAEQLAAWVRSLIRTATDYEWLFEIRKMPEVGLRSSSEYSAYMIELHGPLSVAASAFAVDREDAFDLILRFMAVAIGLVEMRDAGMLVERVAGVDPAEQHAERLVAALLRDAVARTAGGGRTDGAS